MDRPVFSSAGGLRTGFPKKRKMKKISRAVAIYFAVILAVAGAAFSQSSPSKDFPGIKISNFGKMDDRFYRGARPKAKDMTALKAIGIQTIIDLTDNTPEERGLAEAAGLRYVNVAIQDKGYPTPDNVDAFLKVVDDPQTGVFYVHCAGGRHRTGDMGAVYRFTKYGWDFNKVYQEMENYDFYTSNGHGKQKDFVVDYAAKTAAAGRTMAKADTTGTQTTRQ
jgi:protein tyrosine phosphatase (PTP) superfamily phosphohydrolase (DUF442 family)